jgi:hypothetical protein
MYKGPLYRILKHINIYLIRFYDFCPKYFGFRILQDTYNKIYEGLYSESPVQYHNPV